MANVAWGENHLKKKNKSPHILNCQLKCGDEIQMSPTAHVAVKMTNSHISVKGHFQSNKKQDHVCLFFGIIYY